MIFDAFGRLALGQVQQNNSANSPHLVGVAGSGQAGTVLGQKALQVPLSGVSATGAAGGFSGGTTTTGGTPIGALLTITLGAPVTAGNGDKIVAKTAPGAAGTGAAGTARGAVAVTLNGAQGFGQAGFLGNAKTVVLTGVAATASIGVVGVSNPFAMVGVAAAGFVGQLDTPTNALLLGVEGLGRAGTFNAANSGSGSIVISGGGGGKKARTGLEPIAKRPPQKPEPVRLPTYVVPNFKPRPQASPPLAPSPFERPAASAPLDLMAMQKEIQAAQDEADIKSVLEYLDSLD